MSLWLASGERKTTVVCRRPIVVVRSAKDPKYALSRSEVRQRSAAGTARLRRLKAGSFPERQPTVVFRSAKDRSNHPFAERKATLYGRHRALLAGPARFPEVVVRFLYPLGKATPPESIKLNSRQGCTAWDASWRTVKLWEVPAEDLLAAGDIGLVPWVPLAQSDSPPESIMRECRARIDQVASRAERENLLAVTQFLARLR
jgi:hypothetical protein